MIISTPRTDRSLFRRQRTSHRSGAFTLTEAMVAVALSTLVLGGVMSAFLMISRTSVRSSDYSQNEMELRRALELFGQDARLAHDIRWTNDHRVTLKIARPKSPVIDVSYVYDDVATSPTYRCFYRVETYGTTSSSPNMLAREVSELFFQRYKLEQPGVSVNVAANDLETKQLQLTLRTSRRSAATTASQAAISACYILRNKRVSN